MNETPKDLIEELWTEFWNVAKSSKELKADFRAIVGPHIVSAEERQMVRDLEGLTDRKPSMLTIQNSYRGYDVSGNQIDLQTEPTLSAALRKAAEAREASK